MRKEILFGKDARAKVMDGVRKVADAVVTTLGPRGRNVIISRSFPSAQGMQYYQPLVTKDGVTVARNIVLSDYIENTGAMIIREASEKTMQMAGDGTTTTCLLMRHIAEKALELVEQGENPMELKRQIDEAVAWVVSKLKETAIPVGEDIEKIKQIATVSANNDPVIGQLIADAFAKIGVDGIINIEEAKGVTTEIKVTDGVQFNRGWLSPYFITNPSKNECELEEPFILLYDKKISQLKPLEALFKIIMEGGNRPILIISDDADGEALAAIAMNSQNGKIRACMVQSPEHADLKREAMEDLAMITGATYISDEKGTALKNITKDMLGTAQKVIVGATETTIISGGGDKDRLTDHINNLQMNKVQAEGVERENIERRIAKLKGGVAVLYVGAPTETEMREKKDRCDDAVRATKAAIAEGYVTGGGSAFMRIGQHLPATPAGSGVVRWALWQPYAQICANAGIGADHIFEHPDYLKMENYGLNAKTGAVENLIESGIIDPVKVLRCSLENAASAATMLITSETLIVDVL